MLLPERAIAGQLPRFLDDGLLGRLIDLFRHDELTQWHLDGGVSLLAVVPVRGLVAVPVLAHGFLLPLR